MTELPLGVPVKVRADHDQEGRIVPIKFREEDGEPQTITRIYDARLLASVRNSSGRSGIRYTVFVGERAYYLFYLGFGKPWYVARLPAF